jgi:hypothetical protein
VLTGSVFNRVRGSGFAILNRFQEGYNGPPIKENLKISCFEEKNVPLEGWKLLSEHESPLGKPNLT